MMNKKYDICVLHTEHYTITADLQKNRIYADIHSRLDTLSELSLLLEALHDVKHHLIRGFTMLVDTGRTGTRIHWKDDGLMQIVLDFLSERGISKIAELYSEAKLSWAPEERQLEEITPGVYVQPFMQREHAEAWLDVKTGDVENG